MPAPAPDHDAPVRLPLIGVRTDPDHVARFSREIGFAGRDSIVPLTFPFCWLSIPAIRGEIMRMTGEGFLPVHEAQSFVYDRGLRIDADYVLSVELQSVRKPPRIILKILVSTGEDEICARLETTLRLVQLSSDTPS